MNSVPDPNDGTAPQSISDWDRVVFERYCIYDFHQTGYAFPSQELVGKDLGRSKFSVCRSVKRLCAAGWMRLDHRRKGRKWLHNVYELLMPGRPRFRADENRIVQRALARRYWSARKRFQGAVQLNHVVVSLKVEFSGQQRPRRADVMVR